MGKKPYVLTMTTFSSLGMVGFFHTILGTALPAMRLSFDMGMMEAGLLGSTVWLGYTVGILIGGSLSDIFKRHRVVMLACLMMGLSSLFFGIWRLFPYNCFVMGILGAGTGMMVISSSALLIKLYPKKAGMMMGIHHSFYAMGAISGPLAMGYFLRQGWDWRLIYQGSGVLMLALAGFFASVRMDQEETSTHLSKNSFFSLLTNKKLIWLILIAFFGIGTQNGISYWLVSFLKEARSFPIFFASLGLSLFSLGMASGRLLFGWMANRFGSTKILLLLLAFLNITFLLFHIEMKEWLLTICFLVGVGCSGLFPILLTLGGIFFPHQPGTTMGILGTAAGVGSTLMPYLISASSKWTSLGVGFFTNQFTAILALCLISFSFKRLLLSEETHVRSS
jgi:fucose permease